MWGTFLKHAGYDVVVVRGQSEKPVYIWIDDDKIRSGNEPFRGKDARQTSAILKNELDASNLPGFPCWRSARPEKTWSNLPVL